MRRLRTIAIEMLLFSTALGPAVGQTGNKQPEAPAAKPAAQGAVAAPPSEPKPGPQTEKLLRAMEGTWSIREELAPDATSPNGATGEGKIIWRRGPGGFSVMEDYQSKEGAREVTGLGVFWWDESSQGYHTIWCDSTNPGGCINFKNVARWQGAQLVLVEDYDVNGKTVTFKEVFGNITPGAFTQTLYGGESGKELKVDQTIRATKLTPGISR